MYLAMKSRSVGLDYLSIHIKTLKQTGLFEYTYKKNIKTNIQHHTYTSIIYMYSVYMQYSSSFSPTLSISISCFSKYCFYLFLITAALGNSPTKCGIPRTRHDWKRRGTECLMSPLYSHFMLRK